MVKMLSLALGAAASVTFFSAPAQAVETYLLKEPPKDLALEVESLSVSRGGVTESVVDGRTSTTRTDIVRRRMWQRSFLDDAMGGKVTYRMLKDEIGTRVNGQEDVQDGPLDGNVIIGRPNGAGNWAFMLEEGTAVGDQVDEIRAIESIENRKWLPNRRVMIGESWEFVPQFIRSVFRREVPDTVAVGLMELVSVNNQPDGTRQAKIKVVIRAGGEAVKGIGNVVGSEGTLKGVLVVNLDKPGYSVMEVKGVIVSAAKVGSADSVAKLPVTLRYESKPLK